MQPVERRLVTSEVAALFIVRMRGLDRTVETMRSARNRLHYLCKSGKIKNHGGSGRGQALWDLREIARACT